MVDFITLFLGLTSIPIMIGYKYKLTKIERTILC
jgi:hypothetical protein